MSSRGTAGGGRMSEAARAELVEAIKSDAIESDARYAEEFARRHGLNPVSVRSAMSRLRRELGKSKRATTAAKQVEARGSEARVNALALLNVSDATDARFTRVAAAALIRYEHDPAFHQAVDEQRSEIERIYRPLEDLRELAEDLREIAPTLPEDEREELMRLIAET